MEPAARIIGAGRSERLSQKRFGRISLIKMPRPEWCGKNRGDAVSMQNKSLNEKLAKILNGILDPELAIGIVDLGLIYRADWNENGIEVDFATTSPSCPFAPSIEREISRVLQEQFRKTASTVTLIVPHPPWSLERLSDSARRALGWPQQRDHTQKAFSLRCWNTVNATKH